MKSLVKYFRKGSATLLMLLLLYFLAAFIGSLVRINKDEGISEEEYKIFLMSNGIHTDIVLPTKTDIIDWSEIVKPEHTVSKKNTNYISFGWGDLEFYKNTPEWKDLSFYSAINALFLKSPAALHVTFIEDISQKENVISLKVSREQYRDLVNYIQTSFEYDTMGNTQPIPNLHYNNSDVFYRSKGSLNLFNTCNTWVNNALKTSGLKACLWTPFADGILFHYR
ncbi:TIGR02117 family protein [Gillisia marina]|uniref:TIGR02117 family protein n=1 Tax=Gillisia marina TaxID=1167637 RepID=UPI00029A64BD|nr:TIGR02117 family protein [Gillisia marina]